MEPVTVKFEDNFFRNMERVIKKNGYATKTEFIRESVRERIKDLEKEEILRRVDKLFGSSKHKTTDKQLHTAGEKVFKQLVKKH